MNTTKGMRPRLFTAFLFDKFSPLTMGELFTMILTGTQRWSMASDDHEMSVETFQMKRVSQHQLSHDFCGKKLASHKENPSERRYHR